MRKRRIILLALTVALLAVALYAVFRGPSEPSYQGRCLSSWLGDLFKGLESTTYASGTGVILYDVNQGDRKTVEAVRQIGTNAVPFLLSWIRYEPPTWNTKLNGLLAGIGVSWRLGVGKALRANRAVGAFQILGPGAKAAIPELTRLSHEAKTTDCAWRSMNALASLGEEAIPPLASLLTNATRMTKSAMYLIGSMGTNARPAVPALIQCLKDQDGSVRRAAATHLGRLKLEPGLVVLELTTALEDTDANVRQYAASALGKFGSEALSAAPALLNLFTDPDAQVREAATNAILQIAPAAFTNAPPP